ncbi:MAG: hypothetical protein ACI4WW_08215 [Candidatus Coprovivens sp.]
MKKLIIIFILCLLLFGCGKKVDKKEDIVNSKTITKVDINKDYVYESNFKNLFLLDGSEYIMNIPTINLNSDDASNINLEIKNDYNNKYKKYVLNGNVINTGYLINNSYHVNDNIISIVLKYSYYLSGTISDEKDLTYNLSINDGKLLNNDELLEYFNIDEDYLYDYIKNNSNSIDADYIIMNIKNNSYYLYINNDNELVVIYYEIYDNDSIRKELVIN